VIAPGEQVPAATVWTSAKEAVALPDLLAGAPALLLFYLFDWSPT
jgi:peroxiredoxin